MEESGPLNLHYSERAYAQLDDILDYLLPRNERAATKIFEIIQKTCERLTRFPYLGRLIDSKGTHEMSVAKYPYVIAYRIVGSPSSEIEVLGVFHTSLGERKF